MIEHKSWKNIIPQENEKKNYDDKMFDEYYQRINKEVGKFPRCFLKQSIYGLFNDDSFKNEFCGIDYFNIKISSEIWENNDILKIKPTKFGKSFYENRINELNDINGKIEKSSYGNISEIVNFWKNKGTWLTPIIVIKSKDFPKEKFKSPYQLFEGHNRLAWIHYFIKNEGEINLQKFHKIWLISSK